MNFDKALDTTGQDITGVVTTGAYDNFSAEEEAFVEGVDSTQDYYNDIISELRDDLIKRFEQELEPIIRDAELYDEESMNYYVGINEGRAQALEHVIRVLSNTATYEDTLWLPSKETDNATKF